MDCKHDHKHGDMKCPEGVPKGPHGHGGPHHDRKEFLKTLDKDSQEVIFLRTAHKLLHSSKEDLQSGAAFSTLSDEKNSSSKTSWPKSVPTSKWKNTNGQPLLQAKHLKNLLNNNTHH